MTRRAYIAGPITGIADLNKPAFYEAHSRLLLMGYDVANPHDINKPHPNPTWSEAVRRDIKVMVDCDLVVMLPGWGRSRGACLEWLIAIGLGIRVVDLCDAVGADALWVEP